MIQVSLEEALTRMPELMEAAAKGETVYIVGQDDQIVKLTYVGSAKPIERKPGSAAGQILYIAEDFDAPLEDFKEYME